MFIGLFLSYFLLFSLFLIATILPKLNVSRELTRKIVHIGISNWYLIAMCYFDNLIAIIPPITFTILNYLSYRFNIVKGIERENKKELGTIFYPLALVILVLFSYGKLQKPYIGAIGALVLGYGDGLATIIGKRFGKVKLYKNKTLIGSFSMFIISFVTTFILLIIYNPVNIIVFSIIVAFTGTICELISSKGFDNLTVPLISSFIYYLLIII